SPISSSVRNCSPCSFSATTAKDRAVTEESISRTSPPPAFLCVPSRLCSTSHVSMKPSYHGFWYSAGTGLAALVPHRDCRRLRLRRWQALVPHLKHYLR